MKLLLKVILISILMVSSAFAVNKDFIQEITSNCKEYLSKNMGKEFSVNEISMADTLFIYCNKKEINDNLSEQEKKYLKNLAIELNKAKNKLSQKEIDNLEKLEKFINEGWEARKDFSQLTEQEIKSLDPKLRLIFKKMNDALKDGNIDLALTYFHRWSKEGQRKVFSVLSIDKLKEVAFQDKELHLLPFKEQWDTGMVRYEIYTIQNGQKFAFPLEFAQDQGEWKIYEY